MIYLNHMFYSHMCILLHILIVFIYALKIERILNKIRFFSSEGSLSTYHHQCK